MNRTTIFEDWQRYFSKRKLLNEQLLLEGRKENAKAALIRKLGDEDVIKHMEKRVFPAILDRDPTENKKYIEWMARIINKKVLRAMASPGSGQPRSAVVAFGEGVDAVTAALNTISRNIGDYHKLAERNLIEKNIDSFKDLGDWENKIHNARRELEHRNKMKEYEQEAKGSTDVLHDDEDIMIVRPRSEQSSCYYGQGTRWCISATTSRNYFAQYTGEGTGFYFVLFKHLPADDNNKKLALVYARGEYDDPDAVFDVTDEEVDTDAIREAIEGNLVGKELKKSLAPVLRRMKGDKKQEFFKENYDGLWELLQEYKNDHAEDEYETPEDLQNIFKSINIFGDDADISSSDGRVEIYDNLEDHIVEQYAEITEPAGQHFGDNPAGPTEEDFDALYNKYDFDHFHVSWDEYEEGKMYWTAGVGWEVGDEDIEFINEDEDALQSIVHQIMDNNYIYPDDYRVETYGGGISFYADFSPDHDEAEGLEGFERFLDRISEYDASWETVKEESIEAFREANLIGGGSMSSMYEKFNGMNLEHFEVDIEDDELSISRSFEFSIPIPQYMYALAVKDKPSWQQKIEITSSPELMKYNEAIQNRANEHHDAFIEEVAVVFERIFELYAAKLQSALPGFEREPGSIEEVGLILPDANISIYRRYTKPTLGPSGIIADFFFDIRLKIDEAEDEELLTTVERFLRRIDSDTMVKKLDARYENIVINDVVKNIMPEFEEPEEQMVAESKKRKLKILIKEFQGRGGITGGGFGGLSPGLAGMMGTNRGTSMDSHPADSGELPDDDSSHVAKAILIRNSHVLLLKSEDGRWDLPGGHLKRGEGSVPALSRETFEETGLSIDTSQLTQVNGSTGTARFYCGSYPHDDLILSHEHIKYEFVNLQEIPDLEGLDDTYKQMIMQCGNINESLKPRKKLNIILGYR